MARSREWISHAVVKVNNTDLPLDYRDSLLDVMVDTALNLPAMFTLRFQDESFSKVDGDILALGKPVEIKLGFGDDTLERVISGEITAIEPEFGDDMTMVLVVRGYDYSHRLNRATHTRVFIEMKYTDIVKQIAQEAGLQAEIEESSQVFDHVSQDNQSDLAFLQGLAKRIGYEVFVDEKKLYFRKPKGERGDSIAMQWGEKLRAFYPRLSLAQQVDAVTVKGWDPSGKKEIVGKATASENATSIKEGKSGGDLSSEAFSSARQLVTDRPIRSQSEAEDLAKSILNEINARSIEAEGYAMGDPKLVAGNKISVGNLGQRFSGTYMVTSATHIYSQAGYEVNFRVEGAAARTFADLLGGGDSDKRAAWGGVFPAIVTNITDPLNMGRVKLFFPWMDGGLESNWARVMGIGAGPERGLFWLPEVDDEVLVAFEHGDYNAPYVIGGLWNGSDAPPSPVGDAVQGNKVEERVMKTRTGNIIKLADEAAGNYIELQDGEGTNTLKLDGGGGDFKITADGSKHVDVGGDYETKTGGSLTIDADSDITITSMGNTEIRATGSLTLKGLSITIEADSNIELKGTMVTVNGSAMTEIKGGMVMIN